MKISDVMDAMHAFVESKGWYQDDSSKPQTPENLAKSISIESAELLECFQWNQSPSEQEVKDELADIILYTAQLANVSGIDLTQAIATKLERNKSRTWQ